MSEIQKRSVAESEISDSLESDILPQTPQPCLDCQVAPWTNGKQGQFLVLGVSHAEESGEMCICNNERLRDKYQTGAINETSAKRCWNVETTAYVI